MNDVSYLIIACDKLVKVISSCSDYDQFKLIENWVDNTINRLSPLAKKHNMEQYIANVQKSVIDIIL